LPGKEGWREDSVIEDDFYNSVDGLGGHKERSAFFLEIRGGTEEGR